MPIKKLLEVLHTADSLSTPTITMWNRIEGRPRKSDFNRALKAEIRDPLWMLTKQWQMGEFEGDDAGSPILAKVLIDEKHLEKVQLSDNAPQSYNSDIPLEGLVEQMPLPFKTGSIDIALDIRIMIGRYWLKLIKANKDLKKYYCETYPVTAPALSDDENFNFILAHPETWQNFACAENRVMDGYKFYEFLIVNPVVPAGHVDKANIDTYGEKFRLWVKNFFIQPESTEKSAYQPSRLEYQFRCSVPDNGKDRIYEGEEYYSGRLDWFNLTLNDNAKPLVVGPKPSAGDPADEAKQPAKSAFTFIPSSIDYEGMPDTRWWQFEDRKTYLGNVKPDTTDISKLLFLEFSLLYANDWFLIPQELPAASISKLKGLVVTNCFGERTWIEPTGKGPDKDWNRWTMFTVNRKGKDLKEVDNSLLILPTVPKILEGPVLEQIAMVRDEISNMVWAIETDILLPSGDRKKGAEAARELATFYKRLYPEPETLSQSSVAQIRYNIMNSVPENWIPFIPVHLDGSNREIQLQRASMPRILHGVDNYTPVKPRTHLLRSGLDENERGTYFVYEEEVPRAGISVSKAFQRTRWYNGKVFIWLGIHKKTGRGEGQSNLQFDQIVPV